MPQPSRNQCFKWVNQKPVCCSVHLEKTQISLLIYAVWTDSFQFHFWKSKGRQQDSDQTVDGQADSILSWLAKIVGAPAQWQSCMYIFELYLIPCFMHLFDHICMLSIICHNGFTLMEIRQSQLIFSYSFIFQSHF